MDRTDRKLLRVLWVSLVEFPPLSERLGKPIPSNCGWMWSSAKTIMQLMPDLKLGVIVYSYGNKYQKYDVDGVSYYLVPCPSMKSVKKVQIEGCKLAIEDFAPDLIHIHGTEHSLALAVCEANQKKVPVVANIQGLATGYVQYADGGLSVKDKLFNFTPLDLYRGTSILMAKRNMAKRAKLELKIISQLTDIIGRTQWDYDHALTINPGIRYHFMNETLRDIFYEEPTWNYKNCEKHTIFVSNSGAPLKGAHQVLKALTIVLKYYPDTKVNFCGSSVMNNDIKTLLHFQGYHLYLRRLVKKLGLQNNVHFLGSLDEKQMKQAFLDANIYVLPSAIENSPNSLCEAQILGVPAVAAYVGGVPTLIDEGRTGYMYRYEEEDMLAQIVMRLFRNGVYVNLSIKEREVALNRHDQEKNAMRLMEIYQLININK